jgi:hypothetical protein
MDKVRITLKGLEYLSENSLMKKVSNATHGIVSVAADVAGDILSGK